jgi:uncharacterized protein YcsI (UPF0317 family)
MPQQLSKEDLVGLGPAEVRGHIRSGAYRGDSWAVAPGFAQTAMVALPREAALDFMIFAQRNPGPCPLLEVTEPGSASPEQLAPGADLRTDLGKYRVYSDGECVAEPGDVSEHWTDDMMAFVIGCTGSFEHHMVDAGISLDYLGDGKVVPVYVTDRDCEAAGSLHGPLAVSMRPIRTDELVRTIELTSRFPAFHGAPIHVGDPDALGVDIDDPAYGDRVEVKANEVPVFWACSVTPQLVALESHVDSMITNYPSFMFITDTPTEQMAVSA